MGFWARLQGRPRISKCLVCEKSIWGVNDTDTLTWEDARFLLRLIGSAKQDTDFRPIRHQGRLRWLVHHTCASAHQEEMRTMERAREAHERAVREARAESDRSRAAAVGGPTARSWTIGEVEIVGGMTQHEVVRLLGEPESKASIEDFLGAQLSVRSLGGGFPNEEYWIFDILPTSGYVLRVVFRHGKVLDVEQLDWRS